jgi:hypothetical protein
VSSNEKTVRIYRIAKKDYPGRGFGILYNGIMGVKEEAHAFFDTCINHGKDLSMVICSLSSIY